MMCKRPRHRTEHEQGIDLCEQIGNGVLDNNKYLHGMVLNIVAKAASLEEITAGLQGHSQSQDEVLPFSISLNHPSHLCTSIYI